MFMSSYSIIKGDYILKAIDCQTIGHVKAKAPNTTG